ALEIARRTRRGYLPEELSDVSLLFTIAGGCFVGLLAMMVAFYGLDLKGEFGLLLSATVGGVAGFLVGGLLFDRLFYVAPRSPDEEP
ncbi:MAG TPA: hypothetical protein VIM48_11540, partial [Chthoniobacterales bacterium]